jgi:hypothetical protein
MANIIHKWLRGKTLGVKEVEYFTFLRLNICYDLYGMIFTLDVACL